MKQSLIGRKNKKCGKSLKNKYVPLKDVTKLMGEDSITVRGRVLGVNKTSAEIYYFFIMDETGYSKLAQNNAHLNSQGVQMSNINNGDIIEATGNISTQKSGDLFIDINHTRVVSRCEKDIPNSQYFERVQNRANTHESIMMMPDAFELIKKRSLTIRTLREMMNAKGFYEVDTSILNEKTYPSLAADFLTKWNVKDNDVYLRKTIEPKLKLLIIGGFEKIYEIGKVFRNEGKSRNYSPEFTSMDILQSYASYENMMSLAEELFCGAASVFGKLKNVERRQFEYLLKESGAEIRSYSEKLVFFKKNIQPNLKDPTIVYNFPLETCPLAKPLDCDPRYAEEFRLYANCADILHGYSVEINHKRVIDEEEKQIKNFKKDSTSIDNSFHEALLYGMPPTSGVGVGVDRLIQYLSGKENIKDVILFPMV